MITTVVILLVLGAFWMKGWLHVNHTGITTPLVAVSIFGWNITLRRPPEPIEPEDQ